MTTIEATEAEVRVKIGRITLRRLDSRRAMPPCERKKTKLALAFSDLAIKVNSAFLQPAILKRKTAGTHASTVSDSFRRTHCPTLPRHHHPHFIYHCTLQSQSIVIHIHPIPLNPSILLPRTPSAEHPLFFSSLNSISPNPPNGSILLRYGPSFTAETNHTLTSKQAA